MPSLRTVPVLLRVLSVALAGCGAEPGPDGDDAAWDDPSWPEADADGDKADDASALGAASCFAPPGTATTSATLPAQVALGGFRVAIGRDGHLEVTSRLTADRPLFSSPRGGGLLAAARGTLSVEDRQGSFSPHATVDARCTDARLDTASRAGRALVLRGRFADTSLACRPLRWELQLCELRPGHLAFRATTSDRRFGRITLRAASDADERIYGAGEQFARDRIDLKGRLIPVLSQEGGVGRGQLPITPAVDLASRGSGGSEDSTYYAAPHYLTSKLRSLFLENTEYAELDFRQPTTIELTAWAPSLTGRILAGRTPLELIERFTDYAGRMPPLPAWVDSGAIVALARDLPESARIVDELRAHGAAIAAVWNQTWSGKVKTFVGEQVLWNWVQSPTFHPGWADFVAGMSTKGIRTLCYVNPMFVDPPADAHVTRSLYAEALSAGHFVRRADGSPYLLRVTAFDVGLLDLSSEPARRWMKQVIRDEVLGRAGCSGWMADFAEALPFDARLASGVSAASFHNRYPVEWARLHREAVVEAGRLGDVLVWNRSGGARTPAYSLLLWEGDQLTTWDQYDGLRSALHGLLGGGFSGIALNHSDTGGYTSLSAGGVGYRREPELLERWIEMNAFSAVLRTHEGNQPAANAQVYSDDAAMDHFARFSQVYRALGPYRRTLHAEAALHGWPVVRHLWLQYPDDPVAGSVDDEFLLGADVLVAPTVEKCWTAPFCNRDRDVYLPRGEWVHLWTGELHGSSTGGSHTLVKAPVGQPAVFYRRGAAMAPGFLAALRAAGIDVPASP